MPSFYFLVCDFCTEAAVEPRTITVRLFYLRLHHRKSEVRNIFEYVFKIQ